MGNSLLTKALIGGCKCTAHGRWHRQLRWLYRPFKQWRRHLRIHAVDKVSSLSVTSSDN